MVDRAGNGAVFSSNNAGRPSSADEPRSEISTSALSMMVSSMVHMVQAGQTQTDRNWSA